ncbi:isochorismate synthase MenF [Allobranchiibius sp. CTAmp26]|uniref:isochorismate synthase n=1 Tax=Allobranchiibius sp. CTAmp26 TaxID=2815214 RepID=UPI001AA0E62F|nr:isochorismate synthase [Allobranchiibius sp. CTAmp26]MBO1755097.1 isochorismate synthase [Allobranchiibius sp. CTAmp26]
MTSLVAAGPAGIPDLVVRTTRIPDPGDLTRLIPADVPPTDVLSWVRSGDGIVGWGRAAEIETGGTGRFRDAGDWWQEVITSAICRSEVDLPGAGLVAFGSFAFSKNSPAGGSLIVPSTVVGRRGGIAWVTRISDRLEPSTAPGVAADPVGPGAARFSDGALSGAQWTQAVAHAVRGILAGDVDKVVMARDVIADTDAPIDPRWLIGRLATRYANTWTFAVDGLVGATPEMLVRREKGLVTSRVLAGTIQRTGDDAHDLALAGSLARSSKDLEEHEYAVRSVADSLRPHCSSMNVPESPFVLHLPNVMHLATDVVGVLADYTTSLTLAESLHPSAAVCGTPTDAAAAMIGSLEHLDRGRYAGPVGWLDASGDGEWGIALRSGQLDAADPTRMRLFAGCGIVAGSEPEAELAESESKLLPMREALAD